LTGLIGPASKRRTGFSEIDIVLWIFSIADADLAKTGANVTPPRGE
jgi:hypothetical protein